MQIYMGVEWRLQTMLLMVGWGWSAERVLWISHGQKDKDRSWDSEV